MLKSHRICITKTGFAISVKILIIISGPNVQSVTGLKNSTIWFKSFEEKVKYLKKILTVQHLNKKNWGNW